MYVYYIQVLKVLSINSRIGLSLEWSPYCSRMFVEVGVAKVVDLKASSHEVLILSLEP